MRRALTLRNKFTERRALVERARGLRISTMEAVLGHTENYMRLLEFGKAERAAKRFRPIPTEAAAGQARGSLAGGRKREVRPAIRINRLGTIKAYGRGLSRKARNARAVRVAMRSSSHLALLDFGDTQGVFRVTGKRKAKITKLYDVTRRRTPMPRTPTLQRALARALEQGPSIAFAALDRQLTRARASR
jgi:hypothetical protein